jgi:hypothetical protein
MLQLVELICAIVGARIVVTAVVRRPDESPSPTSMEDGVRIGVRAIFRANGEGMPRLRPGPNFTPRASPIVILSLEDLAWQVLASAAAPSLGQTEGRQKRKRESTVK